MMSFEEFQYYIEEHILCGWKEQADVYVKETKKNNGITYQGLYIRSRRKESLPVFIWKSSMKSIRRARRWIRSLRGSGRVSLGDGTGLLYEVDVLRYEDVKNRIIFRLINYDRNRELLTNCPFIRCTIWH